MTQIKAADVAKLRKTSGAGMMDCKRALQESDGDFDKAIDVLRKRGKKIAGKRADREASEGIIIAQTSDDTKMGIILVLNCETDFVAKNKQFVELAQSIVNLAIENIPSDIDALKQLQLKKTSVADTIVEQIGTIGEKLELSFYDKIQATKVIAYNHPGNKLATLVGLNKDNVEMQVGKDVAMQVAAMNPVAIDKDDIPAKIIDKELEIGKEQARTEGKPDNIIEKIALGKLNKFYKESTLLNQQFIKDNKKTIRQYLQENDKELTVTTFKRFSLKD